MLSHRFPESWISLLGWNESLSRNLTISALRSLLDTRCTSNFSPLGSKIESTNRQLLVLKEDVGSVNRLLKSPLHSVDDLIQKTAALRIVTYLKEDIKGDQEGR